MCASVRQQMMLGVNNYLEIDRTQWMQNWPGQIVLNGSQVQYNSSGTSIVPVARYSACKVAWHIWQRGSNPSTVPVEQCQLPGTAPVQKRLAQIRHNTAVVALCVVPVAPEKRHPE